MYTPPGAKRGHSDWNVSNCILPTWLPSSMTISMGGTDSTSSSQNSGSSWLPIQIDVLWSSSSPGNQQKNNAKRTSGHVCHTSSSGLMRLTYNLDQLLAKNTHQNAASHTRERAAIHTRDSETRPKIRLIQRMKESHETCRTTTSCFEDQKLFVKKAEQQCRKGWIMNWSCWKVQGWSSNIQPKSLKQSLQSKKSLGVVTLKFTKSMVPYIFPLRAGGFPHADHRDLMVQIQKTRWTSPGYRCLTESGGMFLKILTIPHAFDDSEIAMGLKEWWNWTSQWIAMIFRFSAFWSRPSTFAKNRH